MTVIFLNSASLEELTAIFGEEIAERIIAYRNQFGYFHRLDDLLEVEGITYKMLTDIEPRLETSNEISSSILRVEFFVNTDTVDEMETKGVPLEIAQVIVEYREKNGFFPSERAFLQIMRTILGERSLAEKDEPSVIVEYFDINLNADPPQSMIVQGLPPELANNIVDYRNKVGFFKSVAELAQVRGRHASYYMTRATEMFSVEHHSHTEPIQGGSKLNTVSGRVVEVNSTQGVKDLIVVLYDIDLSPLRATNDRSLTHAAEREGFKQGASLSQYLLQVIFGLSSEEEDQEATLLQPSGDRIGSVITNRNGEFSITYDDTEFRIHDNEMRPDLVLLVLAPDSLNYTYEPNSQNSNDADVQTHPFATSQMHFGTPEHRRILHITMLPIGNAGRQEQMIIRISDETLAHFGLQRGQKDNPAAYISQLVNAEQHHKAVRKGVRDSLNVAQKVKRHRAVEAESETFVANLSAVPAQVRNSEFFVGRNQNAQEVQMVATRAREEGINTRLAPHGDPSISAAHMVLRDKDLELLGIPNPADFKERIRNGEQIEVPLNARVVCRMLQEKMGGSELTRVIRILERISSEQNSEENEDDTNTDESGNGNDGSVADEISAEEQIKQLVLDQVRTIHTDNRERDEYADTEASVRIKKAMEILKPPASPADVTAFHDFSHLQIAFPNVWTEAFDRDVTDIIKQLHIEYRTYEDGVLDDDSESIFGPDGIDPDEIRGLNEYSRLMGELVGDISAAEERPLPPLVRQLINDAESLSGGSGTIATVRVGRRGGLPRRPGRRVQITDTTQIWNSLSIEQQEILIQLASERREQQNNGSDNNPSIPSHAIWERALQLLQSEDKTEQGLAILRDLDLLPKLKPKEPEQDNIISQVLQIINNPEGRTTRAQELMQELAQRLSEPHSFRIFRENSINFGVVTTYRQEWRPGPYQVADLVGTLPLAPGETRKYAKKQTTKKTRAEKTNEQYASTLADERAITSRAVADIMEKANTTTNFSQTVSADLQGSIGVFTVGANSSSQFQRNQGVESQRVKKAFREAVRKASQEYKNERSLEVSAEDVNEFEFSTTSEISNPNNEITITYLFYELERQYKVSERLHRLTPVILVAQEVPEPADIDEDWLLTHEWILRRSLLDNTFHDALDYISEGLVSDEVTLEVMREHYETQKYLVEDLAITVDSLSTLQETLRDALVQTSEQEQLARFARKRAKSRRRRGRLRAAFGFGPPPGISNRIASGASSLGFGSRNEPPEVLEARREALETRLEYLEGNLEDARSQLTRAESVLEKATADLTAAVQESFTRRNLVDQLRIHVKENILHYSQTIWSYEKPDQRFFRLYDLPVQIPTPHPVDDDDEPTQPTADFTFSPRPDFVVEGLREHMMPRFTEELLNVRVTMPAPTTNFETRRLHEIADLDNLLGMKGNYLIFPLKECAYITDFMMHSYIDNYLGIRDPGLDELADYSTEELIAVAERIEGDEEALQETRNALIRVIQERLTSSRLEEETIVVPTGQLFIEALKGEHALLENFKEQHRAMDMLKVHEEVQSTRLENLRKAMRLVSDQPLLDDPNDNEKRYYFQGTDPDINVME